MFQTPCKQVKCITAPDPLHKSNFVSRSPYQNQYNSVISKEKLEENEFVKILTIFNEFLAKINTNSLVNIFP